MPGDTLKFENGAVLRKISGSNDFITLDEPYLSSINKGQTFIPGILRSITYNVPQGEYFLMGDNRIGSADSRSCFLSCSIKDSSPYVKGSDIIGKVMDIDFPPMLTKFLSKD